MRKLPRRGVHRPSGTLRALFRGALAGDEPRRAFENEAADAFGARRAFATGSGRAALSILLRALELEPGDEVIVPALTFRAVPETIATLGLVPRWGEVDPHTLLLDPKRLCGTRRTRVVLATHLFGLVCDMDALETVCQDRGWVLLEDFAQAAGARSRGRPVGALGRAGFTSLETVKPLAAFGGGLVTTDDEELAGRIEPMCRHLPAPDRGRLVRKIAMGHVEAALGHPSGFSLAWPLFAGMGRGEAQDGPERWIERYKRTKQGSGNHGARLTGAQAAAGRRSLAHLQTHLEDRRRTAARLRELLEVRWLPQIHEDDEPSWYQFVVRTPDPRGCAASARRTGVDVGQGIAADLSEGRCPGATQLARELVQLPCHPQLEDRELERVATTVKPWLV